MREHSNLAVKNITVETRSKPIGLREIIVADTGHGISPATRTTSPPHFSTRTGHRTRSRHRRRIVASTVVDRVEDNSPSVRASSSNFRQRCLVAAEHPA